MTLDTYTPPPPVTISGTGPYAFARPYAAGTVMAWVLDGADLVALVAGVDYTVSPTSSTTGGNVTLSGAAAALHAGRQLVLIRDSNPEQGWAAVQAGREKGLEVQLDALAMAVQDLRAGLARALRLPLAADPLAPEEARTLTFDAEGNPVLGPTVAAIDAAATAAAQAIAAAAEAVTAAGVAQAAEASLIRDAGVWTTATTYSPSDLVTQGGSTYVCLEAHTSGTFSTDLSGGLWRVFAAEGASGVGTGDVLAENNGSEFADKAATRTNLGLGAASDVQHRSLLLDGAAPFVVLRESDGNAGFNVSRWRQDGGALELRSEAAAGTVLSTDLRIEKDAGGAARIVWSMGGAELLELTDGQVRVLGAFTATGQVGEVFWWFDEDPPPHGLELDGAAVSRSTYADLFAIWGTRFGAGNGTTTFNLPDLRGYVLRAWDNGRGIDAGRDLGTFQDDAFQAHTHSLRMGRGGSSADSSKANWGATTSNFVLSSTAITTTIATDGGVPRTASETRPKNVAAMACVRI
jgi:microcystin-dependent protein